MIKSVLQIAVQTFAVSEKGDLKYGNIDSNEFEKDLWKG